VDLLNNLDELAEDRDSVLRQAQEKMTTFDQRKLSDAVERYGNVATRKRFKAWING
jgi:hypothetical protein